MDPPGLAASSSKPSYKCSQNEIDKFGIFYLIELDFYVEICNVHHLCEVTIFEQKYIYNKFSDDDARSRNHESPLIVQFLFKFKSTYHPVGKALGSVNSFIMAVYQQKI